MLSKLLGIRIFDIEASSRCNVRCRFCPREALPQTGLMSRATFDRLLEALPLGATDSLAFVGLGEPLMNPALPDFLLAAKARHPRVRTWVTTNGTLLTQDMLDRLLATGLDVLDISFNGIEAQSFEASMRGAHFAETLANVERAVATVAERKLATTVQVNFVLCRENADREAEIKAFWRQHGVHHFRVQRFHNRGGLLTLQDMSPQEVPTPQQHRCDVFDVITFVAWNGDVLYCCHDVARNSVIGNLIRESWNAIRAKKHAIKRNAVWPSMCFPCNDPLRHSLRADLDRQLENLAHERLTALMARKRVA